MGYGHRMWKVAGGASPLNRQRLVWFKNYFAQRSPDSFIKPVKILLMKSKDSAHGPKASDARAFQIYWDDFILY